jgi:hypothetical protein
MGEHRLSVLLFQRQAAVAGYITVQAGQAAWLLEVCYRLSGAKAARAIRQLPVVLGGQFFLMASHRPQSLHLDQPEQAMEPRFFVRKVAPVVETTLLILTPTKTPPVLALVEVG